jgi:hypothetical protein
VEIQVQRMSGADHEMRLPQQVLATLVVVDVGQSTGARNGLAVEADRVHAIGVLGVFEDVYVGPAPREGELAAFRRVVCGQGLL